MPNWCPACAGRISAEASGRPRRARIGGRRSGEKRIAKSERRHKKRRFVLRNYEDLEVWQKAHALTIKVYRATERLPAVGGTLGLRLRPPPSGADRGDRLTRYPAGAAATRRVWLLPGGCGPPGGGGPPRRPPPASALQR